MKRISALLLAIVCMFALVACGNAETKNNFDKIELSHLLGKQSIFFTVVRF